MSVLRNVCGFFLNPFTKGVIGMFVRIQLGHVTAGGPWLYTVYTLT